MSPAWCVPYGCVRILARVGTSESAGDGDQVTPSRFLPHSAHCRSLCTCRSLHVFLLSGLEEGVSWEGHSTPVTSRSSPKGSSAGTAFHCAGLRLWRGPGSQWGGDLAPWGRILSNLTGGERRGLPASDEGKPGVLPNL